MPHGLRFFLVMACSISLVFQSYALTPDNRPNIILVFVDDMGWGDMAAYGNAYIRTPSLDRLAAEGQRWTDFYVPSPVCPPSRRAGGRG